MRRPLAGLLVGAIALGAEGAEMQARDGARDFDFWMGSWKVHNRRLRERLKGSTNWDEFGSTSEARPLLGGVGNEDVFRTDFAGGFTGMSFRFFDKATGLWSIHWADSRFGTLDSGVVGSFKGDVGVFEGSDTFEGRSIRVRYTWSRVTTPKPRWEQAFSEDGGKTWETNWVMDMTRNDAIGSREYPVVEVRRYEIKPGERERFARCFEGYFAEAFQQMGMIAFGQFLERKHDTRFTWVRGFPSYDARADMNTEFYTGPLWKEHSAEMNARLVDVENVLLLRPAAPGRGLRVLPAVDAAQEGGGPAGVVVLQIFAVKAGSTEAAARLAEEGFAAYRAAGAREAGVLVTLDAPNNYPRLPIRTDGPHLVWVGVVKDDAAFQGRLAPLAERTARALGAQGLLREPPELVLCDPTRRSRLRWRTEGS
jgi:NIPSNAP